MNFLKVEIEQTAFKTIERLPGVGQLRWYSLPLLSGLKYGPLTLTRRRVILPSLNNISQKQIKYWLSRVTHTRSVPCDKLYWLIRKWADSGNAMQLSPGLRTPEHKDHKNKQTCVTPTLFRYIPNCSKVQGMLLTLLVTRQCFEWKLATERQY